MRLILFTLAIAVIAASASSFKPRITDNPMAYANAKSREFARGDSRIARGWRECIELENNRPTSGIMCEGTRSIEIPGGQIVDVNYFCEFVFVQIDARWSHLDYQFCQ